MVTIVSNAAGVSQGGFYRVEEYAFFVFIGEAKPVPTNDDFLSEIKPSTTTGIWFSLIRYGGINALPSKRKGLVYPIAIDPKTDRVAAVGRTLAELVDKGEVTGNLDKWTPPRDMRVEGFPVVWPYRGDGSLATWQVSPETLLSHIQKGYVRVRKHPKGPGGNRWSISYVKSGTQAKIESGEIETLGREGNNGELVLSSVQRNVVAKTVWRRAKHDAGKWGSRTLREILGSVSFDYAKSPYVVLDTLLCLLSGKKQATVLDFFAGSGTTYHAVSLMNAVDGGQRQCILVTNNEVSDKDRKPLLREGSQEGDSEWEKHGICQVVTWPRCKYVTQGKRGDGTNLQGEYATGKLEEQEVPLRVTHFSFAEGRDLDISGRKDVVRMVDGVTIGAVTAGEAWHLEEEGTGSILWDIDKGVEWIEALSEAEGVEALFVVTKQKSAFRRLAEEIKEALPPLTREREVMRPMAEGFEENLAYFELGFLDPGEVERGQQFAAILPLLWMLTGSRGACPKPGRIDRWLIAANCGFAVLHKEALFEDFRAEVARVDSIDHVFLVTDSEEAFREMRSGLRKGTQATMLYSSYLRNFGINTGTAQ